MKIICIGRNYADHATELNNPLPKTPLFFLKPDSAILKNGAPFFIPEHSDEIHHEIELIVKINRIGKHIEPKFAHKYYNEIGIGIDFAARDVQEECKQKGWPWEIAKAFDGSALIGKYYKKDLFSNPQELNFSLEKNEKLVQSGNSNQMIFDFNTIISYVSRFFTLKIGDVIFTGTPAGVSRVQRGDTLVGYLEGRESLKTKIC